MSICNYDCFNCVFDDCINDEPESRAEEMRYKYAVAKSKGLCTNCKKRIAVHGVYCEMCYEHHRESSRRYRRERNARLKAAGLCLMCGKQPATHGQYCEPCTERARAYQKAARKKARAAG